MLRCEASGAGSLSGRGAIRCRPATTVYRRCRIGTSRIVSAVTIANATYATVNPFGKVVEDDRVQHPCDERTVGRCAAQSGFPGGERAGHADHAFDRDERDGGEVQRAEAGVRDPVPATEVADPDEYEADDDEGDKQRVDDEDRVGEEGAHRRRRRTASGSAMEEPDAGRRDYFSTGRAGSAHHSLHEPG